MLNTSKVEEGQDRDTVELKVCQREAWLKQKQFRWKSMQSRSYNHKGNRNRMLDKRISLKVMMGVESLKSDEKWSFHDPRHFNRIYLF